MTHKNSDKLAYQIGKWIVVIILVGTECALAIMGKSDSSHPFLWAGVLVGLFL